MCQCFPGIPVDLDNSTEYFFLDLSIKSRPSEKKVYDLLEAADYFQMVGLKEMCGRLLIDTISVDNCLELLNTAFKYSIKNLKKNCNDFFVVNRSEVLARTSGNLSEVVGSLPPMALELLGIELADFTSVKGEP
jgi:hypothetical protein